MGLFILSSRNEMNDTPKNVKYPKNQNGEYYCPHCPNYTATRINTMLYHMKKHIGEYPHQCKFCDCKFNYYKPLEYHILSKHPEKVPKEVSTHFQCPFDSCSYSASNQRDRRVHYIRKHCKQQLSTLLEKCDTGFVCTQCKREFKSRDMFCYHAIDCLPKTPALEQL